MDFIEYLPEYYKNSKVMKAIQEVNETELKVANNKLDDLLAQFSIDTATWGLDLWEENYNIKVNHNKSYDERRAVVKAKKRGKDTTTTIKMLENVAKSFIKEGSVHLEEDYGKYAFTLDLGSRQGFPYDLQSLYNIIEEIKPAHLESKYKITSILNSKLYIGAHSKCGEEITVYPYIAKNISTKGNVNITLGNNAVLENIIIYPRR